ncbi:MAG: YbaN family protein [Anaerolineales bacterium]
MKPKSRFPRWLLIGVGSLSVALGALGIFVPLLPTTPFLLLAAACFVRSSPRLYRWLITHRWFGTYIRNYREHRVIPLRFKVLALTLLWLSIGYAILAVAEALWLRLLLAGIAVGVTVHLVLLRTEMPFSQEEPSDATALQEG